MKKILIAISGASGFELGLRAYEKLPPNVEKYLVTTPNAPIVAQKEGYHFQGHEIWAGPASGSFGIDGMLVAPCSMNTLAKIAAGIGDNLPTRAARVMVKERRPLVLAPRELPLDPIALEAMLKLAHLGVFIAPPILAYYSAPKSLEEMEDFIIGKWFDLLGIEHDLYRRWQ
ncbi:MAG: 3-octaprenyl-4-hydroxybenzoate carboxy-lyase [Nitratiruptor sp.]|nr:3-octaprenyl-4-hydroxybenzoate carboxy-lyase [Nitratiruptor sp.]NPA84104.1 UbiX family flavin prenyltransferase [Campylobacterota bacterium]